MLTVISAPFRYLGQDQNDVFVTETEDGAKRGAAQRRKLALRLLLTYIAIVTLALSAGAVMLIHPSNLTAGIALLLVFLNMVSPMALREPLRNWKLYRAWRSYGSEPRDKTTL